MFPSVYTPSVLANFATLHLVQRSIASSHCNYDISTLSCIVIIDITSAREKIIVLQLNLQDSNVYSIYLSIYLSNLFGMT